jgi:hypothetical protein
VHLGSVVKNRTYHYLGGREKKCILARLSKTELATILVAEEKVHLGSVVKNRTYHYLGGGAVLVLY